MKTQRTVPCSHTETITETESGNTTITVVTYDANSRVISESTGGNTTSYTYDNEGVRTSKTFGDTTTYYITDNGYVVAQYEIINNEITNLITFIYDNSNDLIGFTYDNEEYFYLKNIQGDITDIVDASGNQVASYHYNAWGVPTITKNTDNDLATLNPLRYRGYYYDEETAYYYLQSRYYAPQWCRFLNSDLPIIARECKDEANGLNLFVYCGNDSVNNFDYSGYCYKKNGKIVCENWATAYIGKQSFSGNGLKMLKACEGFYSKAYKALPSEPYYTIGYGHYGSDVKKNQTITKSEASTLLKKDIKLYEKAVNSFTRKYSIRLSTPQFDSLVIDCYQRGQNIWKSDKYDITKFLKKSQCFIYKWYNFSEVKDAFLGTVTNTGGLPKRRKAEAKLFYYGTYQYSGIYD